MTSSQILCHPNMFDEKSPAYPQKGIFVWIPAYVLQGYPQPCIDDSRLFNRQSQSSARRIRPIINPKASTPNPRATIPLMNTEKTSG